MAIEDEIRKCIAPISENARTRIWMSRGLSVYYNSEFACAIFPIAISLFWDKGGREIVEAEPLSTIFTILTHCLGKTSTNNYSIRPKGQWSCQDVMLEGSSPLAPLGDFGKFQGYP